ncbi:MAG TPA: hypothetical protein VE076_09955 [Nitrososphaeraceae archaeon]|nr:hypothetical protein [Nitrososphaeraceae archaeon]
MTNLKYYNYGAEAKKQKSNIIDLYKLTKEYHQSKKEKHYDVLQPSKLPPVTKTTEKDSGELPPSKLPPVSPNGETSSDVSKIGPVTIFTTTSTNTHTKTVGKMEITTITVLTTNTYVRSK